MTLSDTQTSILRKAAQHPDGLVIPMPKLPPGPRVSIARALLNAGLVARAEVSDSHDSWKLDGEVVWLAITRAGRQAIGGADEELVSVLGAEHAEADEAKTVGDQTAHVQTAPATPPRSHYRTKLRDAVTELLALWDATTERESLFDAMAVLRATLDPTSRQANLTRMPRKGTKQEAVLALLRRPEGATITHVVEATGWAQHTVRGFFAGLKKKGHTVEVLDRVRRNGPGSAGAKGSYSTYRIAEAG